MSSAGRDEIPMLDVTEGDMAATSDKLAELDALNFAGLRDNMVRVELCKILDALYCRERQLRALTRENRELREKNAEIRLLQFKGAALQAYGSHVAPNVDSCQENAAKEPHGERLRVELEEWLNANKIVSILMDTKGHLIEVHNAPPLPPNIRPVLTHWGSIYVETDEYGSYEPKARAALAKKEAV